MKKTRIHRFSRSKADCQTPPEDWHGGADIEIALYARSLHFAAKTLVGKLGPDQKTKTDWDVCPIVLLYRQALEIRLKELVGEGSKFLATRTDPISLYTTRSLRWLAQIVCQIIRAVNWSSQFTCNGVSCLAEFNALINEIECFDPVARSSRSSTSPDSVAQYYRTFDVVQFSTKLDALLDLLDSTADALAATWDQRADAIAGDAESDGGNDFKPTIQ